MAPPYLAGKICVITGAASGIGRALAEQAGADGARLILTDINAQGLEEVVQNICANDGTVLLATNFDIADYDAVRAFADEVHAAHGPIDVLVNNAGIAIWGQVQHLQHEHWRQTMEINLMGPIHMIESFVPAMIEAGRGGHLVNVSSAAGLFGLPWHAAYSASKFGLRGVSEVLRFDLRRYGIKVSTVCPGGVDTGLVNTVQVVGIDQDAPAAIELKEHFRERAVSPDQAARAILKGLARGRTMIFTSNDIRVGYWFQRKFAWPYELVMRALNRQFSSVGRRSRSH